MSQDYTLMYTYDMNVRGFTIVELIIAIVVIGILTALGTSSYRGAQEHARLSAIEGDMTSALRQAASFKYDNGFYPKTANDVSSLNLAVNKEAYGSGNNYAICSGNRSFGIVSKPQRSDKYYVMTSSTEFKEYTGTLNIGSSPSICSVALTDSTTIQFQAWGATSSGWSNLVR